MRRRLTQGSAGWLGRLTRPAGSRGWQPGIAYIHACMNARMHTRIHTNMSNMHNMPNMHDMQNMMHRCTTCMCACMHAYCACRIHSLSCCTEIPRRAASTARPAGSVGRLGRPARPAAQHSKPGKRPGNLARDGRCGRCTERPGRRSTESPIHTLTDAGHSSIIPTALHEPRAASSHPDRFVGSRP